MVHSACYRPNTHLHKLIKYNLKRFLLYSRIVLRFLNFSDNVSPIITFTLEWDVTLPIQKNTSLVINGRSQGDLTKHLYEAVCSPNTRWLSYLSFSISNTEAVKMSLSHLWYSYLLMVSISWPLASPAVIANNLQVLFERLWEALYHPHGYLRMLSLEEASCHVHSPITLL